MLADPHHPIIVLNGASSSGKTSIVQALVTLLDDQCVCTGLDEIMARVQPFGAEDGNKLIRSLRILYFTATDGRLRLFKQMHREIMAHYNMHHTVIVETAYMDPRALHDAAEQFALLNAFLVGIKPPLSVSLEWERQRGDRPIGQAQKHYDQVHAHGIYDLEIDSSRMTPADCAKQILLECEKAEPHAFRQLYAAGSSRTIQVL